jgi:hypothetical protein
VSVRKRTWKTAKGETKEAWVVWYSDQYGRPHIKTFARKREADAYHAKVRLDVASGVHVPDSASITVAEAGANWIAAGKAESLQRTTLDQYGHLLRHHIVPFIGAMKLSKLTLPTVIAFRDRLREEGRSADMVKRTMTALSSILACAVMSGRAWPERHAQSHAPRQEDVQAEQTSKLEEGVEFPHPTRSNSSWRPLRAAGALS